MNQLKTYAAALVLVGKKEVLQKTAVHGTQGTTEKNDHGSSFEVVYFEGVGWVTHYDFGQLEKSGGGSKRKVA